MCLISFLSLGCARVIPQNVSQKRLKSEIVNLTVRAGFVTSFNAVQGSNGQIHICVAGPGLASD